jgi:hypothetical protein
MSTVHREECRRVALERSGCHFVVGIQFGLIPCLITGEDDVGRHNANYAPRRVSAYRVRSLKLPNIQNSFYRLTAAKHASFFVTGDYARVARKSIDGIFAGLRPSSRKYKIL